jgi:hypothetical protein
VGGKDGYAFQDFSMNVPPEWMRLDTDHYLLLSKDGPFLQYILVQQFPVERPFQHTARRFRKEMLPQETAEVILDDMASDQAIQNVHLLASEPATLHELQGFRLLFTYENPNGLTYKTLYYGFIKQGTFYSIRYNAAERYYFEKDLGTFQSVLSSLQFASGEPS